MRTITEEGRIKRKQVYDGGKVEGQNTTYRELITGSIEEVKKIKADKRALLDRLNILKDRQRELDNDKQTILKAIPRNFHSEKDVQ